MVAKNLTTTRLIALIAVAAVLAVAMFARQLQHRQQGVAFDRVQAGNLAQIEGMVVFPEPKPIAMEELIDQHGQPFPAARFNGRWTLAFFGFTHCPDICPNALAELARMGSMVAGLPLSNALQPLLVSVDPDRDTPEQLQSYLESFGEQFVGVTGEPRALRRFASQFHVSFQKQPLDEQGENYDVGHSAHLAIIGPEGRFRGFFKQPIKASVLARGWQLVALSKS